MATVSCIVACYNAAATLEAAVRSALDQVGIDVEVIIADDCSDDESLDKARAMASEDARVRVVAQETRGGPSRARNKAMALATGEWVAILDADDEMLPNRLSSLVAAAEAHQSEIAFDNLRIIGNAGDVSGRPVLAFAYEDGLAINVGAFLNHSQTKEGRLSIGYAKPIFAAPFLRRYDLRYDERFSVGEDWKFFLTALAMGGRCVYVDDPLYLYYRPETSLTRSGTNNYRILLKMTRACEADLARVLQPQDRRAIRSLCGHLRAKAVERTLRNAVRWVKSSVQRGRPST